MSVPKAIPKSKVGRFDATVIDHDLGISGEDGDGSDFVYIRFGFVDGEGEDTQVVARLYFTEKTLASQYGPVFSLTNLGWNPDQKKWALQELARKDEKNPEGGALMGAKASITTEVETYEGKQRLTVAWINEPGGGGARHRASDQQGGVKASVDRIRALVAGTSVAKPPSAGGGQKATAGAGGGKKDNLPF